MPLDLIPYAAPLSRTPIVLRSVIEGRSDAWLDSRHGPDVFSPRETVAHLVACEEESWMPRVKWVLEHGDSAPYVSPGLVNEDDLLSVYSVSELLARFESLRAQRLRDLVDLGLSDEDLDRPGIHLKLGAFKLGNVLAAWVAHDLYHLGQIFKSYSAPYVEQVGPWQKFLNLPQFN